MKAKADIFEGFPCGLFTSLRMPSTSSCFYLCFTQYQVDSCKNDLIALQMSDNV